MQIYVINLDRSPDRLAYMTGQLERRGLSFERIAAVDRLNVPADLAPYFAHITQNKAPIIDDGAVGCYASHLRVYQKMVADGVPHALVLEDDASLAPDLADTLRETLRVLPDGWDFVHVFRTARTLKAYRTLQKLPCGLRLVRFSRVPFGCTGYLISAAGARKLLNPTIPRFWAIDTDTRRPWLFGMDSYGVVDGPVGHSGLPSTIQSAGQSWRRGLPRPTPYSWTNLPLYSPAGLAFNMRKLGVAHWLRCLVANGASRLGLSPAWR